MVNFPGSLDSLANPSSTTKRNDPGFELHTVVSNLNDIAEALETKLGTGSSTATANTVLRGTGAGATEFGKVVAADITAGAVMRPIYDTAIVGPVSSFDVSGISTAYRALFLQLVGRGTAAAGSTSVLLRFNNDSAGNYDYENFQANNATVASLGSVAQSSIFVGSIPAASVAAGIGGQVDISIGDYTNTTYHKIMHSRAFVKTSAGAPAAGDLTSFNPSGTWRSTAAINRITILPSAGNFDTGTRLTIWGLPI